jgi:uncharacterized protein
VIYLDANVIIRLVEGFALVHEPIKRRLISEAAMVTSQLSRLECRCHPIKHGNQTVLSLYDQFFTGRELRVVDIDQRVIEEATHLRAAHGFKSPDAIHLATAIIYGTSAFLTGDVKLARCMNMPVEII